MSSYLTNYPSPENYEESVFYWWFEFLKRNYSYKKQCEIGFGGVVYQHFGNIFDIEFLDWWNSNDHELLFLPETSLGVWPVKNNKDLKKALADEWMVFSFDPKCTKKTILYWLEEELFSQLPDARGKQNVGVTELPTYKPYTKPDVQSLKKTLAIYDLHLLEPKPLYKIYDKIQLREDIRKFKPKPKPKDKDKHNSFVKYHVKYDEDDSTSRRVKTQSISRYILQARKLIENVEKGEFPKLD